MLLCSSYAVAVGHRAKFTYYQIERIHTYKPGAGIEPAKRLPGTQTSTQLRADLLLQTRIDSTYTRTKGADGDKLFV
jgi:hypothetical protein